MRHHVYKLFFRCDIIGGTPEGNHETIEVDFFAANQILELSLFCHSGSFERIYVISANEKSTFDPSLTKEG